MEDMKDKKSDSPDGIYENEDCAEEMDEALDVYDQEQESDDGESEIADEVEETSAERVYIPHQSADENDAELERDESAYVLYHEVKASYPCLSFDVIPDELGDNRADEFPLSMTLVAGTQADKIRKNNLMIMKLTNMNKGKSRTRPETEDEDNSDSESSDEEDEDSKPVLEWANVPHPGCVNRIRATNIGGKPLVATWSEIGKVMIWDITRPLEAIDDHRVMASYVQNNEAPKPVFSFVGHNIEGYALAWSKLSPGTLVSGDCRKHIHLWKPVEGGTWFVNQKPFKGHTASVEDIQWSPNEANVMATCSADKSIRIWDVRAAPNKACMLTEPSAHDSDVNVIHWNQFDPLLVSGGDDGHIKVWDIRNFPNKPAVCTFKHHLDAITSVEWHPTDSSVFAASGADHQISVWDLGVERDVDLESTNSLDQEVQNLPSQLLFIHQGQKEIKELHWHHQMPGVVISTAMTGFNVFRTISV